MTTVNGILYVEGIGQIEINLPIFPMDVQTSDLQKTNYSEYKAIEKAQDEALNSAMKSLGFKEIYTKCFNNSRFEVKNNQVGGIISTWHSEHESLDLIKLSHNSDLSFDIKISL